MTSPGARLAVLLRSAQWELDRTAFHLPRGEVSTQECCELAHGLEEVARQLRLHATRERIAAGERR